MLINENNPSLGYRPFHRRYVLGNANGVLQGVRTSDTGADDYAVYVQDRWAPTSRLSISPGLRVEWIAAAGQAVQRADAGVVELRAAHRRRLRADRATRNTWCARAGDD